MSLKNAPTVVPMSEVAVSESEIAEVTAVLRSGRLREGPVCRDFEEAFAARVGANHAVSVNSGTAALHVAYAALLRPEDEVLVPTFTFIATASMVVMAGARPVFCDVDPKTFTLDVGDARKRITKHTRAIAPVHLFGNPSDVDGVRSLADEYGLLVIWDAAQAAGTEFGGRDVGSEQVAVCYSFYPSKNMTTGEGGMITTSDPMVMERCKLLRSHGQEGKYHHSTLGFNYRLTDILAALGLKQLEKLDGLVERRRANARYLTEQLQGFPGIQTPIEQSNGKSSFNLYSILIDPDQLGCGRDELVRLLNGAGVSASVHYPKGLHQQPAFASIANNTRLPVAEDLARRILSLPAHPGLDEDSLGLVVNRLRTVVDSLAK